MHKLPTDVCYNEFMKTTRVAINGLGRIGRAFLKLALKREGIEIVAVNDLADIDNLAYLLKYDTVYGRFDGAVEAEHDKLVVNGRTITVLNEREPGKLPWRDLNIDIVVEATGVFDSYEKSRSHLEAGAKKVIITAPVKDAPPAGIGGATVLVGVNEEKLATCQITSNASCTTNAASPLIQILDESIGIEKAILNTVHGYTASQAIVDGPDGKDYRRGRAGAVNIVPSTTGAAIAVTKAITTLAGKFDGVAIRVPVPCGSLVDITFISKKETSVEEINDILSIAAKTDRWKRVFAVTDEPLVSADIVGTEYAAIADLQFIKVVGGNLVKVLAWYDNEMGYAHTLVEHIISFDK